jgi:hypothetical protein
LRRNCCAKQIERRFHRGELAAIETDLAGWYGRPPFAEQVARLAAYRGVTRLGGLTLASEVGDWHRFATTGQFMGLLRADPQRILQRHQHLAGPHHQRPATRTCAPSWSNPPRPTRPPELPWSCPADSTACPSETIAWPWTAQLRLCGRFRPLQARKNAKQLVVIAVARELAGLLWAEMVA